MDTLFNDWNSDNGFHEFPLPTPRKSLGLDNDLVELLWQNGGVVLQAQTSQKQSQDLPKPYENSSSFTHQNDNLVSSWIDCPIDNIDKEFCPNVLPEIPPLEKGVAVDFASHPLPHPYFGSIEGETSKNNVVKRQTFSGLERERVPECSAKTIGSSNQQVVKEGCTRKDGLHCNSTETGTLKQVTTSSGIGSDTTCWNTGSQSIDTSGHKRKNRDVTESECRSDATELEYSGGGHKSSSQRLRRSRVAEVHNLSERRRRDRINEKMKALQELIPHSNKSDKASMLDEAIEYMKSLQLQLQLLWMGSGMAPMMLPGIQPYMSRMGMRAGPIGPPMLPAMQNLMRLSRFPIVDPTMTMPHSTNQTPLNHSAMLGSIDYQNQIPNMSLPEQYANYMAFLSMPNGSQPMNLFNYGANSAAQQMNQSVTPQTKGNQ